MINPKDASFLKVQKKQATTSRVLKRDLHNHILYILKLHDPGYLDKYISYQKGFSLLKVKEKLATNPKVLEIDSHNHI